MQIGDRDRFEDRINLWKMGLYLGVWRKLEDIGSEIQNPKSRLLHNAQLYGNKQRSMRNQHADEERGGGTEAW